MSTESDWTELNRRIERCRKCPRLRDHCEAVAITRRRAYADQTYWARPVTGFGDHNARIWIIGLAPGAHGANRTGRVFTGDRSGDFLYAALHRAGLANQPTSISKDDGLKLRGVFISAAARCAPPGNKPTPIELATCSGFLKREAVLLHQKRVLLCLGRIAWDAAAAFLHRNVSSGTRAMAFAHGAEQKVGDLSLLGSYHVSQQNTFTGRLTEVMFDQVVARAKLIAGL